MKTKRVYIGLYPGFALYDESMNYIRKSASWGFFGLDNIHRFGNTFDNIMDVEAHLNKSAQEES